MRQIIRLSLALTLALLLCTGHAFAALPAQTLAWEVRTAGADTNGGGFVLGQGSKIVTGATDLVIDGTLNTKVTSATRGSFVTADVGRWINATAGTSWTIGWYKIQSISGTAAILDHSPGAVGLTGGTFDLWNSVDMTEFDNKNAAGCTNCYSSTANLSVTDGVTAATTTITSATANFSNILIGNVIHIQGGTGSVATNSYQVVTVPSATSITVDRSTGLTAGTGVSIDIAGALLTIGQACTLAIASNKIFVKAGSGYTITAGITCAQTAAAQPSTAYTTIVGYTTTRTDGGMVTITGSTNTGLSLITFSGTGFIFRNFTIDCANLGTCTAYKATAGLQQVGNFVVKNFTTRGLDLSGTTGSIFRGCEITGGGASSNTINTTSSVVITNCNIHDNAGNGVNATSNITFTYNLVLATTGYGLQINVQGYIDHNTFYNGGSDAVVLTSTGSLPWVHNNIFDTNVGYGINEGTAGFAATYALDGNCYHANTAGTRHNIDDTTTSAVNGVYPYITSNDKFPSTTPFVDAAGGNFVLNAIATGGSICRAVSVPASFLNNSTTSFADMGAVQSQTAAGGGGAYVQ